MVGAVRLQGHLSACWAFHVILGTSHREERLSQRWVSIIATN